MGDIYCPTCGEPWDAYHLRHDAIWETILADDEEKCSALSRKGTPLTDEVREALAEEGWEFPRSARSVLSFVRCPACPNVPIGTEKAELRQTLSELLGEDEDALQAELEDLS